MNELRLLKFMVLVCILMIPVLIILFLRGFTQNQYDIPVLFESGVEDPFGVCDYPEGQQHFIPDFTFQSQENDPIGRSDMRDKITVVDFFFTSCPSICPVMSTEMERVQDAFRNDPEVQIYSISIDPEYDSPEVLAEYGVLHGATSGKWFFLSGPKEETLNLARCGFALPIVDGNGNPDDFVHSDKFILIDGEGRIRGYYSGTEREEVDKLILETKILLYELENKDSLTSN
jgi:protein SCO1/2